MKPNTPHDPLELVHQLMHQVRALQRQALREEGDGDVTPMEARVLGFFARRPGATLKELAETIRESKPRGVAESIRDELAYAIRTENFERAAKLRDDLRLMESSATPPLPAPREPVRLKP